MAIRDYRLMAFLVAIADAGSIRGAARRLGVSAPVVSTALADLEANLGTTLARRGQRQLKLTPDGLAVYEAASEMVRAGERALSVARRSRARPRGRVAMTLPTALCVTWLPPILREFEAAHPEIETSIHAIDTIVDLPRSDYDLAIRAIYTPRPTGHADAFDILPLDLVASQAMAPASSIAAARARPIPLIDFSVRETGPSLTGFRRDGTPVSIPTATRIRVNDALLARELARAGLGAALVPREIAADDLARGSLVRMLGQYSFGFIAVRLLQRDRHPSTAARALVEFLHARARPRPP